MVLWTQELRFLAIKIWGLPTLSFRSAVTIWTNTELIIQWINRAFLIDHQTTRWLSEWLPRAIPAVSPWDPHVHAWSLAKADWRRALTAIAACSSRSASRSYGIFCWIRDGKFLLQCLLFIPLVWQIGFTTAAAAFDLFTLPGLPSSSCYQIKGNFMKIKELFS